MLDEHSNPMELQSSILLAIFSLLLFEFLRRCSKKPPSASASRLPPGPPKLPLLGNIHLLAGGALPHRALRELSVRYGPLMHLQLGEVPAVVVSSPETAMVIMRTHDLVFASRPVILASEVMSYGSKDIAFAPYGEFWRQMRKICVLELLSSKKVRSFQNVREEEYSKLVEWAASQEGLPVNVSEMIFTTTYGTTSRIAFGRKSADHEEFVSVITESMKLAAGFDVGDVFPSYKLLHVIFGTRAKLERMQRITDRILEKIVKDHRDKLDISGNSKLEEDDDDLIDILLKHERRADKDFTLTIENIKAVILDVFSAGSDTSATAVDWALSEMIRNPRLLDRAQAEVRRVFNGKGRVDETGLAELEFLRTVIKETLRLHPPLPLLLPRECRESCEINGYEIPTKSKIIINGWAINRDPKHWKEPDTFNPDRFVGNSVDFKGNHFAYIPFGAGRRICPGMNFGMANIELPLAMLLYHFDWELPEGARNEDMDMTESFGVTVKRKEDLYLIPRVHRPPPSQ